MGEGLSTVGELATSGFSIGTDGKIDIKTSEINTTDIQGNNVETDSVDFNPEFFDDVNAEAEGVDAQVEAPVDSALTDTNTTIETAVEGQQTDSAAVAQPTPSVEANVGEGESKGSSLTGTADGVGEAVSSTPAASAEGIEVNQEATYATETTSETSNIVYEGDKIVITTEMLERGLTDEELQAYIDSLHLDFQGQIDMFDELIREAQGNLDTLNNLLEERGFDVPIYHYMEDQVTREHIEYEVQMENALNELREQPGYENFTPQEILEHGRELGLSDELIFIEIFHKKNCFVGMTDDEISDFINSIGFDDDIASYFIYQAYQIRELYSYSESGELTLEALNKYLDNHGGRNYDLTYSLINEDVDKLINKLLVEKGLKEEIKGKSFDEIYDILYDDDEISEILNILFFSGADQGRVLGNIYVQSIEGYENSNINQFIMNIYNLKDQEQYFTVLRNDAQHQYDLVEYTAFYYSAEYVEFKKATGGAQFDPRGFTTSIGYDGDYQKPNVKLSISYEEYLKEHPDCNISIMDFYEQVMQYVEADRASGRFNRVELEIKLPEGVSVETMNLLYQMRQEESMKPFADTFDFLYYKDPQKALEYLNLNKDTLNKYQGYLDAMKEIKQLKLNPDGTIDEASLAGIINEVNIFFDGVGDGIYDFGEGFEKIFKKGELSAQDYKVMVYMAFLAENGQISSTIYKSGNAVGNMLPTVTVSLLITYFAPELLPMLPFKTITSIAKYTALGLNAISGFGTTSNQLMFSGYGEWQSRLYAFLSSTSGFLFEKYLGGILGMADNPGSTFLTRMINQGKKNLIQMGFRELFLDPVVLQTPIDLSNFPEEYIETVIIGMITAGCLNAYTGTLRFIIEGAIVEIKGEDALNIIKILEKNPNSTYKEATIAYSLMQRYPNLNYNQALILNQASEKSGVSQDRIMKQNTVYNVKDSSGKTKQVIINSLEQWEKFFEYTKNGMTESEALNALLDEYAKNTEYDGWLTADDIKAHVREAYDRLPAADKKSASNPNGLSYEDFLKIKLQLIPYDPQTQMPNRYQQVQTQMQNSGSVTLFWGQGDMERFLNGSYSNGIGRPANDTQESAAFAFPSSEMKIPSNFSTWTPEARAKYLSDNLGLDSNNFKSGAYQIIIDESVYGDSWTYSDPYKQGSNQDYVPGLSTSSSAGKTEVIIPRVDDVIQTMDPSIRSRIDLCLKAGDIDQAATEFFNGITSGAITLKPGVSIRTI